MKKLDVEILRIRIWTVHHTEFSSGELNYFHAGSASVCLVVCTPVKHCLLHPPLTQLVVSSFNKDIFSISFPHREIISVVLS